MGYFKSKTILFFVLVIFTTNVYAQEENAKPEYRTLLGEGLEHGGYGAFSVGYTKIGEYNAFTGGIKGAWLINHSLGFGIAGSGFITQKMVSVFDNENDAFITGGYGGFLIEPIFYANNPIHFSLPIIIGGGGVTYIRESYINNPSAHYPEIFDTFFVVEPGIELELNMVKFFRIALGISYRFTSDIDLSTNDLGGNVTLLGKKDMNQFVAKLVFKFGKF